MRRSIPAIGGSCAATLATNRLCSAVEDELAALRIPQQQAAAEASAVMASQRAVQVILDEYRAGTVVYTSVITEQEQLLTVQQAALSSGSAHIIGTVVSEITIEIRIEAVARRFRAMADQAGAHHRNQGPMPMVK